jgi:hypothetical protein
MTKSSPPPDKNVDKMGYMSVMVGDSAALFNAHLQEHGQHYGTAARHIGQAFQNFQEGNDDGVAVALLSTAHRVLASLESAVQVVPWITLGATWHLAATTCTAMATWHQARATQQLATALQHQITVRQAPQLLLHSTTPSAILAVIQTAYLYAHDEGGITDIHLVLSDSYQAAQVRIQLLSSRQDNGNHNHNNKIMIFNDSTTRNISNHDVTFRVFESLQDAFDAASSPQHTGATDTGTESKSKKVLIYVATLQPLYWNSGNDNNNHNHNNKNTDTVLRIHNCHDFVLRADVGHDTGPRLVFLNGTMISLENSKGKFHGVALANDFVHATSNNNQNDTTDSLPMIQFVRCTTITTTKNNTSTYHPCHALIAAASPTTRAVIGIFWRKGGLLLAGSFFAATAVSAWFYYTTNNNINAGTTNRPTKN